MRLTTFLCFYFAFNKSHCLLFDGHIVSFSSSSTRFFVSSYFFVVVVIMRLISVKNPSKALDRKTCYVIFFKEFKTVMIINFIL